MRKCEKARDFNSGSVLSNILYFSLPYLLSYFLQTLYGMADLFIIGQFDGTAATTAVSLGSQVMHMLTVILVGLAMGTTVSIGQAVGARDKKRAGEAIGNTVVLFLGVSVALMVLLTVLVRAHCGADFHAGGGCGRYDSVSDDLFYRYSLYHCLQCDQFHFPGPG